MAFYFLVKFFKSVDFRFTNIPGSGTVQCCYIKARRGGG